MIAILTNSIEHAVRKLHTEGTVEKYSPVTRKGTFMSGRQFVVVNHRCQLEGIRLSDYRIVGDVARDLVDMARAIMCG